MSLCSFSNKSCISLACRPKEREEGNHNYAHLFTVCFAKRKHKYKNYRNNNNCPKTVHGTTLS